MQLYGWLLTKLPESACCCGAVFIHRITSLRVLASHPSPVIHHAAYAFSYVVAHAAATTDHVRMLRFRCTGTSMELHTSGSCDVPARATDFARGVRGSQRARLWWSLPPSDAYAQQWSTFGALFRPFRRLTRAPSEQHGRSGTPCDCAAALVSLRDACSAL